MKTEEAAVLAISSLVLFVVFTAQLAKYLFPDERLPPPVRALVVTKASSRGLARSAAMTGASLFILLSQVVPLTALATRLDRFEPIGALLLVAEFNVAALFAVYVRVGARHRSDPPPTG